MKHNLDKRTLWVAFLTNPSEREIQDAANTMKNGKAYLFKTIEGDLEMHNKRHLHNRQTFVRKVIPTI